LRPLLIVGLGNEIASDDGVGILAAQRLARRLEHRTDVEVRALAWAGLSLLDVLVGRERAALVDSLSTGTRPPGSVVRLSESDFRGSVRLTSFHDIDYATALGLGRRLGWPLPDQIAIWAIEGAVLDRFGCGLSPPVAAALEQVVNEVAEYLDSEGAPA
jgi:hydrogenase maturation protease